ncbi:MAG: hypothetical protein HS104_33350 [Polyangiaceae bacterium]|nr:hypothetical protein [Polyangiaceae bacterium]MCE7889719.1 hypothetical protein [Sorangiineae bacterium PRO1]MCL4753266.1 hypothetical protein [Myxococcales bacterium]
MRRTATLGFAALLLALLACDSDGMHGGPNGDATRFCQESLGRIDAGPTQLAEACKSCCTQEVRYEGRIDDGKCVCH